MISIGILLLVVSSTYAYVYCPQQGDTQFAFKIPKHSCACNANTAGTLRYQDNKIQFCNGRQYVNVAAQLPIGSREAPASSCKQIYDANRESKNGEYYLKLSGKVVKTYCVMDAICGSRGWTMIMKIDGNKKTFGYDSTYWRNTATYNVNAAADGLNNQETKLETYSTLPFSALCLGMKTGNTKRWLKLSYRASSLYSLIADGRHRATRLGRNAWKNLIPGSSLQRNCNREGFNVAVSTAAKARIGIISNQENDCGSPDSRIGFGTSGSHCLQNSDNSAGNEARCSPDNGDKSIKSFGYILAQ